MELANFLSHHALRAVAILSFVAWLRVVPLRDAAPLALCSAVCFFPVLAAAILAQCSEDLTLPLCAALIFALCSSENGWRFSPRGRFFHESLISRRVSGDRTAPRACLFPLIRSLIASHASAFGTPNSPPSVTLYPNSRVLDLRSSISRRSCAVTATWVEKVAASLTSNADSPFLRIAL